MNIFSWLLLGHLVGDWLLQNDWMAQGKRQGFVTVAGLTHFVIYTVVVMLALGLARPEVSMQMMLVCAGLVFGSHWVIDATNVVEAWMRLFQQSDMLMIRIMVDQIFHLIILAVVAVLLQ